MTADSNIQKCLNFMLVLPSGVHNGLHLRCLSIYIWKKWFGYCWVKMFHNIYRTHAVSKLRNEANIPFEINKKPS